jgi:hypothetical protein
MGHFIFAVEFYVSTSITTGLIIIAGRKNGQNLVFMSELIT